MALIGAVNAQTILSLNLRRLRVARGLSQERLAFEAKIDRSYVGRIERGTENVTIATIEAMAMALGVGIDALFKPVDPADAQPSSLRAGRKPKVS